MAGMDDCYRKAIRAYDESLLSAPPRRSVVPIAPMRSGVGGARQVDWRSDLVGVSRATRAAMPGQARYDMPEKWLTRRTSTVIAATSQAQILSVDQYRWGILVCRNITDTVFVAPWRMTAAGQGFEVPPLGTGSADAILTRDQWGGAITMVWFAWNDSVGPLTLQVGEIRMRR